MFKIESCRYGNNWEEVDVEFSSRANLDDLSIWVKEAQSMDSFGGKYEYRVVDETGKEFYHSKSPYERVKIDICVPDPATWLDKIRYDYGISVIIWKQACEAWLEWEKNRQKKDDADTY